MDHITAVVSETTAITPEGSRQGEGAVDIVRGDNGFAKARMRCTASSN